MLQSIIDIAARIMFIYSGVVAVGVIICECRIAVARFHELVQPLIDETDWDAID